LPAILEGAGKRARDRIEEFFTARIENDNTRRAYLLAARRFFWWLEEQGIEGFSQIKAPMIARYLKQHVGSKQTRKQHLAAIRMLFDYLVTGHVIEFNPALSVRGPKHVVKKGKTPILTPGEARQLIDSIDTASIKGLRDRAIIGAGLYTFARASAIAGLDIGDYYSEQRRSWLRFHEKGGKEHAVPVHHNLQEYIDAYIEAAGISRQKKRPLFRTIDRFRVLTDRRIDRRDLFRMIKYQCERAGLPAGINFHSLRGTGITTYLKNEGSLEVAQEIAGHASARTTKMYDRRSDEISLDEVERIVYL
jgi:site-specific recombinase XerD